ncbi:MAG: nicotinate phosphoribosyltransferase [Clostridia bacterium]|nr:nicotinate phosphoribosyltransferase [Clostridia bacterium]
MDIIKNDNNTMLADFYQLTMAHGYWQNRMAYKTSVFDMFFRRVPDGGGFSIMAGVEQLVEYLKNLKFTDNDIEYLRSKKCFSEKFLAYLRDFKFECDVWAIREGTPVFPGEPVVVVRGPAAQAQFIETMCLLTINHQCLIATKANRMVRAAKGRTVLEFGSRRAQGASGAILGARAAFIGGVNGTACVKADIDFGVPAAGTMAHSWVQMFDSEFDAFKAYAEVYPDNCILLIDTYNVLKSGIPNAIKVAKEILEPQGQRLKGVRIDSGDMAYLTKKMRAMLDEAGLEDCKIIASNALDENLIADLINQGACIDTFGIGERLIVSRSEPVFGGVYKLVATEEDGVYTPKIKISENVEKVTTPCFKQVYRFFDNETGKALGDVLTLHDEVIDESQPYTLFHPVHTWKKKVVENYTAKPLLEPLFVKGECVYQHRDVHEIRDFCKEQVNTMWPELLRFENPQEYYVDYSKKLWTIKQELLERF